MGQPPVGVRTPSPLLRRLVAAAPSLEEEMLVLRDLVAPGGVCLDVGASYGTYTVWLARLVGPSGRVHAFEPRPRSRAVLAASVRLLAPGNVSIHPVALADRAGHDVIVTPKRRWWKPVPGRSFLKATLDGHGYRYEGWDHEFGGATERPVVTDTLDAVVGRHGLVPDLLKIDVEGAEVAVLAGAAATLRRHRPVVLCEIEDRHSRKYGHRGDDVLAVVRSLGYRPHVVAAGVVTPVDRVRPDVNNYLLLPELI